MKICSRCEAINSDAAQFCCKCGTQLGASQHNAGSFAGQRPKDNQAHQQQYQPPYQQPQYQAQQPPSYQPPKQTQNQPTYQTQHNSRNPFLACVLGIFAYFIGGFLLKQLYFWMYPPKGSDTLREIFTDEMFIYAIATICIIEVLNEDLVYSKAGIIIGAALLAMAIAVYNSIDNMGMIILWNIVNIGCIVYASFSKD